MQDADVIHKTYFRCASTPEDSRISDNADRAQVSVIGHVFEGSSNSSAYIWVRLPNLR